MTGRFIGVAALAAWELHQFREPATTLNPPLSIGVPPEKYQRPLADYRRAVQDAPPVQYWEIFLVTAIMCTIDTLITLAPTRKLAPFRRTFV